jgi:hypothetical protein
MTQYRKSVLKGCAMVALIGQSCFWWVAVCSVFAAAVLISSDAHVLARGDCGVYSGPSGECIKWTARRCCETKGTWGVVCDKISCLHDIRVNQCHGDLVTATHGYLPSMFADPGMIGLNDDKYCLYYRAVCLKDPKDPQSPCGWEEELSGFDDPCLDIVDPGIPFNCPP